MLYLELTLSIVHNLLQNLMISLQLLKHELLSIGRTSAVRLITHLFIVRVSLSHPLHLLLDMIEDELARADYFSVDL